MILIPSSSRDEDRPWTACQTAGGLSRKRMPSDSIASPGRPAHPRPKPLLRDLLVEGAIGRLQHKLLQPQPRTTPDRTAVGAPDVGGEMMVVAAGTEKGGPRKQAHFGNAPAAGDHVARLRQVGNLEMDMSDAGAAREAVGWTGRLSRPSASSPSISSRSLDMCTRLPSTGHSARGRSDRSRCRCPRGPRDRRLRSRDDPPPLRSASGSQQPSPARSRDRRAAAARRPCGKDRAHRPERARPWRRDRA